MITGIVISIILGIVAYSRSNKYFLESDGEIVYCGSTIWMKLHGRDTSQENIELICKYNPPPPILKNEMANIIKITLNKIIY
ncbi:hypothetical protein [Spiroplasma endosymbiont of Clivina fossor]|uniref:hypothetical protein n=1 Tax=Spiroplasma endosymbiont of Clivina fossor TaxID=3066282 RepID=UPI00313BAD38